MSVAWTQNGSGQYLVESAQHLLQIMNQGALGADTGTPPADYWSASYLQTSDIDLVNDHASIVPIGVSSHRFTGVYDGGLFQIMNWSYTVSSTVDDAGLFGFSESPAVLKHIRLAGVWALSGDDNLGFLAGYLINSQVYDVEANFETGTTLTGDSRLGALIGLASSTSCREITLRGTVDFSVGTYGTVGGLIAYIAEGSEMRGCRNLGTFPNGISGSAVGGIAGHARATSISTCVNAMQGNLTSTGYTGGICGELSYGGGTCDSLVNSMVGDLSSSYGTGGIFGIIRLNDSDLLSCTKILNYMKGDINSNAYAGGIVGKLDTLTSGGDPSAYGVVHITTSVVAMQGAVDQTVRGWENAIPAQVEVAVDTTFDMTYNGNEYGQSTMVVDGALLYHPDFADLPYVDMSGTDPDGILYNWDFVYANIGGKYPEYTHLSVHTAEVSAPYFTDFGLPDTNDVVYLTYANIDTNTLHHDPSLTVVATVAANTVQIQPVVTWTQNGSGQYLVESKEHLLQIMNQGALYTNAGSAPIDYFASSYLQTTDIDLINDHASILPIGDYRNDHFIGEYDGGLFTIANWSYTGSSTQTGLFGYCDGVVLKRIRLSGVWTSTGGLYAGLLCGYAIAPTVTDVDGDFSAGTFMNASNDSQTGGMFGKVEQGSLAGVSIRGTLDIQGDTNVGGGVIGDVDNGASVTQCRNLATFPSGITGNKVGGIVGELSESTLFKCLNVMTGDLVATSLPDPSAGGICGYTFGAVSIDFAVNSMTGNVTSGKMAGGVVGYVRSSVDPISFARLFNYMTGDVSGSSDNSGGLMGYIYATGSGSITKSIVAMSGTVDQSVRGSETIDTEAPPVIEVSVDTSFGMTSTGTDHESATMVVDDAFVYDPGFTDLPYFVLSGTVADGNTYPWDFVYANIGGKYPEYTHLSVHTAAVSAPYYTDFGLGDGNTVVYLTYANIDTSSIHHDPLLTVVSTVATTIIQITGDAAGDSSLGATVTKTDFLFDGGNVYDITEAGTQVSAAANDLFATGDAVAVNVNGNSTTTTFVNRGGELDITGSSALLLPFDPNVADVQDATLTLSDATSVDIGFDQPSGQITVDGITYSAGDYFIMDGKKVTVVDI